MAEKFSRYDTADYLKTEEDMALYLDACIEEDPGDGSLIRTALAATHGRRMEAAQRLGIGRNTITRKIQELGLDAPDEG